MSKKTGTKQERKRRGETKGDKKTKSKKEKRQYNAKSKKREWAGKKLRQKGNKKKEPKIKVLASFHSLLSNASSLVIRQSFKSLFMNSSHVKFGRSLPLFSLPVRLIILVSSFCPLNIDMKS
jgi:hypothetical protein